MKSLLLFILVLTVCWSVAGAAGAVEGEQTEQAKATARAHFKTGVGLMKAEDWNGAVASFEESVTLYPTKTGLYNLANAYRAVHHYALSLETFQRLLDEYSGRLAPEMSADAGTQIEELEALLARVEVRVDQPGATVYLGERELVLGTDEEMAQLVAGPGEYRLRVTKMGYVDAVQAVRLVAGGEVRFDIALEPQPVEPEALGLLVEDEPTNLRPFIWSGLAMTVATGATAAVFWYFADRNYKEFQGAKQEIAEWTGAQQGEEWDELVRRQEDAGDATDKYSKLAIGLGIGAGTFLLTTGILWIVDSRRLNDEELETIEMSFSPGGFELTF